MSWILCLLEVPVCFDFLLQLCRVTPRWSASQAWRDDFRRPITCQHSWQMSGKSLSLWLIAEVWWRSAEQRLLQCAPVPSRLERKHLLPFADEGLCKHIWNLIFVKRSNDVQLFSAVVSKHVYVFLFMACGVLFRHKFLAIMVLLLKVAASEVYCGWNDFKL